VQSSQLRLQRQCPIDAAERAFVVTTVGLQHGQMLVRQGLIRIQCDGTFEAGDGIAGASGGLERNAQIGEHAGIVRRQARRLPEVGERFLVAAQPGKGSGPEAICASGTPIERDGSLTAGERLLGPPQCQQRAREIQQHRRPVGLQFQRGRHQWHAGLGMSKLRQGHAQALHQVGVARRGAQQILQDRHRFLDATRTLMLYRGFEPFATGDGCHVFPRRRPSRRRITRRRLRQKKAGTRPAFESTEKGHFGALRRRR